MMKRLIGGAIVVTVVGLAFAIAGVPVWSYARGLAAWTNGLVVRSAPEVSFESLRAQLRDEHAGLDSAAAEISLLEHDKAELERQLASFRKEQRRLKGQLSAARTALEKNAGQPTIEVNGRRYERLAAEADAAALLRRHDFVADGVAKLPGEVTTLGQRISELKTELADARQSLLDRAKELDVAEADLRISATQAKVGKVIVSRGDAGGLNASLEAIRRQIARNRAQADSSRSGMVSTIDWDGTGNLFARLDKALGEPSEVQPGPIAVVADRREATGPTEADSSEQP